MEGGGLHGYFREQGLSIGVQTCLERFHRQCIDNALTTLAGSLFQNGTARMLKVYWRWWVKHVCWWNLDVWPRSPVRVGGVKMLSMGNSKRPTKR